MPHLGRLEQQGGWASVAGPDLVDEMGTWLQAYSGVGPWDHGYYSFRQLKPGTYDLVAFSEHQAHARPFWAELVGTGLKALIVDANETGLIHDLDGTQIAHWRSYQPDYPTSAPQSLPRGALGRVCREFGGNLHISDYVRHPTEEQEDTALRTLLERIRTKGEACRSLIQENRYDLIVIAFAEAHLGAHRFWSYQENQVRREDIADVPSLAPAILWVYQAIDREVGRILACVRPDPNVLLTSMYGMKDQYPTTDLTTAFCHALGFQIPSGSGNAKVNGNADGAGNLPRGLNKVSLRLRRTVSKHFPRALQESRISARFRAETDWTRTTAFAIPGLYSGYIRVNLQGREPEGVVRPGRDYHALLDRIEADLSALVDPTTGEAALESVVKNATFYNGEPPQLVPDLVVHWKAATHFHDRLIHPTGEVTQSRPDYFRETYHQFPGFIIIAGPGFDAPATDAIVSPMDIAPTCLHLLRQAIPAHMSGKAFGCRWARSL